MSRIKNPFYLRKSRKEIDNSSLCPLAESTMSSAARAQFYCILLKQDVPASVVKRRHDVVCITIGSKGDNNAKNLYLECLSNAPMLKVLAPVCDIIGNIVIFQRWSLM